MIQLIIVTSHIFIAGNLWYRGIFDSSFAIIVNLKFSLL